MSSHVSKASDSDLAERLAALLTISSLSSDLELSSKEAAVTYAKERPASDKLFQSLLSHEPGRSILVGMEEELKVSAEKSAGEKLFQLAQHTIKEVFAAETFDAAAATRAIDGIRKQGRFHNSREHILNF